MRDLPTFEASKTYWLGGETLNEIMAAIRERTVIPGPGLLFKDTPMGRILRAAPSSALEDWAFRVRWSADSGEVDVSAGTVYAPIWIGTVDPENPQPIQWNYPTFVSPITGLAVSSGQSVFLVLTATLETYHSLGAFPYDHIEGTDIPSTAGVAANFWLLDSVSISAQDTDTPPASTDNITYVPLADVVGTNLIHRQMGDFYFWQAALPFIDPNFP